MLKHQVVWPKLAVTNPKDGQEMIVKRGDMLPDWVDDFTRFVLAGSGGVKAVETPDPALIGTTPEPVRLQEHKPESPVTGATDGPPAGNASREVWAAYATSKGAPAEDTRPVDEGGLKQTDLRAKYGG